MKKIYKKLEAEQIERGVIFSSHLIGGSITHEITKEDMKKTRLKRKRHN